MEYLAWCRQYLEHPVIKGLLLIVAAMFTADLIWRVVEDAKAEYKKGGE